MRSPGQWGQPNPSMRRRLLLLVLFGVAMGYMEAAVVVYLRGIFYPEGFSFPIKLAATSIAAVEVAREAATIVMLLTIAMLAEKGRRGRFACFVMLFGIWDIAYYVFLWVTLGWPASILDWDILFLIPVIWTGPVLAPVLVSVLLVTAGLMYYARRAEALRVSISRVEWAVAILGGVVIFATFVFNHSAVYAGQVPRQYPWALFAGGMAMPVVVLARVWRRLTSSC